MINRKHIVEKVSVDVDVTSMALAEKIKSEINDFIQKEVLSIIESYFDELPAEFDDKIIQLDRVSLSIDTSSWNVHSEQLKLEIRDEVKHKLDPMVKRVKEKSLLLEKKEIANPEQFIDQEVQLFNKDERILKSFFHFLDHGILPWWLASLDESRELFSENKLLKAIRENSIMVARELKKRSANARFVERMVKQFPSSIILELIAIKLSSARNDGSKPANGSATTAVKDAIQKFEDLPREIVRKIQLLIWNLIEDKSQPVFHKDAFGVLFQHIHSQLFSRNAKKIDVNLALNATYSTLSFIHAVMGAENDHENLKRVFVKSLNEKVPEDVLKIIKGTDTYAMLALRKNETSSPLKSKKSAKSTDTKKDSQKIIDQEDSKEQREDSESFDELNSDENKAKSNTESEAESEERSNTKSNTESEMENSDASTEKEASQKGGDLSKSRNSSDISEIESKENLSSFLEESVEDSSIESKKIDDVMPNELFVNNAGLVLLNPFLPALFKQLNLVSEDGKLLNPQLGAYILHYAATGRERDFEFEMVFEKYLCGIPPFVSLDKEITLSEIQKEEVTKVLNSVLVHWSVMKSNSTALLQNEFLMRPGKLIVEASNHRLVIERKTFDLLLDKLPWSYSMIKFSWKKDLIFVEW